MFFFLLTASWAGSKVFIDIRNFTFYTRSGSAYLGCFPSVCFSTSMNVIFYSNRYVECILCHRKVGTLICNFWIFYIIIVRHIVIFHDAIGELELKRGNFYIAICSYHVICNITLCVNAECVITRDVNIFIQL